MKKWAFIVNPVAGNDFASEYLGVLNQKVSEQGITAEIAMTGKQGDATTLAEDFATRGFDYVIGVGGDGTMNEIATALLGHPQVVTGLIPAGTGNDFIQILGFPDRFSDRDWEIFFRGETIQMDVGTVNGQPFLNGMGLGFDAEVAARNYRSPDEVKKGGKGKYLRHILTTLFFYREKRMIVKTLEGEFTADCFMQTVSIGRRFAGGFFLTPKAIANDGLLDVCSISRLSLFHRLRVLTMVPKGTHIKDKRIHYFQTHGLRLSFPVRMPYHRDGELGYGQEFEISLIPKALTIIYNPEGSHYFSHD